MKNYHNLNLSEFNDCFDDIESLWFWFVSSKMIKTGFRAHIDTEIKRPCQLVDVEALVTKLYLSGHLTKSEVNVLTRYGILRRVPNKNFRSEEKDAVAWDSALDVLRAAALKKGWLL